MGQSRRFSAAGRSLVIQRFEITSGWNFNPVLLPDPGVGRSLTQEGTNDGWEAARLCLAFGEPPEGKGQ